MRSFVIPPGQDETGQWHVLKFWPYYGKWFEVSAELTRGQFTAEDFGGMVASGQGTLFTFWLPDLSKCVGIGLVEMTKWGDDRLCIAIIRAVAGEQWQEWKHYLGEIEAWAKKAGADRVVFDGRKGWARVLKEYKVVSQIYEKTL